jgi:hypothetical protein
MKKRLILSAVLVGLLALGVLSVRGITAQMIQPAAQQTASVNALPGNILPNADFDDPNYPFYWRYPNHFVGGMWFEWWAGPNQPEFIDGGIKWHNVCYPVPPWGICVDDWHNSSQGYIRWGGPYIAGLYQPVHVDTCYYYRFSAWNRNDDSNYHPKVGIDPTGYQFPINYNEDTGAWNCPPDGNSKCPKPSLDSVAQLPATIHWSPEFDHAAYTWAPMDVTVEAFSTTMTVWTFVAPDSVGSPSRSTYWDYAALVKVPPPNGKLVADGVLPAADGFNTNVTTQTIATSAWLWWQTSQPAFTQVLYHYVGSTSMTSTPPIANVTSSFEFSTAIDYTSASSHAVHLGSLRPTSVYDYAILARRFTGSSCQTSVITGRFNTTDMLVPQGTLPAPGAEIIGATVFPYNTSTYVVWQSAHSGFDQVLYNYNGPITSTLYPTMTQIVHLPIFAKSLSADSTGNYAQHTQPSTLPNTLHIVKLDGLTPDSNYAAVAVSGWTESGQDQYAVSAQLAFQTVVPSTLAAGLSEEQLAGQLQACLSNGGQLEACVGQVR